MAKVIKCTVVEKFEKWKGKNSLEPFLVGTIALESQKDEKKENVSASSAIASTSTKDCVTNTGDDTSVMPCYLNNLSKSQDLVAKLLTLEVKSRCVLTYVIGAPSSIRLTEKSKVLTKVGPFHCDMTEIKKFINPPIVTLAEARGSPLKRRLSVKGDITELGQLMESPSFKRRSLRLEEEGVNLDIILWGDVASTTKDISSGMSVTIRAVIKDRNRYVSTPSSTIEGAESSKVMKKGMVIAVDDTKNYPLEIVLESGECLRIPEGIPFDVKKALLSEMEYVATMADGTIEKITAIE